MTRIARAVLVAVLSTAFFAWVFRFDDPTWRSASLGGWLDPYFINGILEHWRVSLLHGTSPASPPMYYPATHTLGYSCGLILYVPWYVLLRVWCDPFVAHTLTIFTVLQVGTWSLYALLRRFRLEFATALVLTGSVVTSLNVVDGLVGVWSQRASVYLVPQVLWLAAVGVTSPSPRRRVVASLAAGLMGGLMFVQDFPSAALTTLAGVLVLAGTAPVWGVVAWLLRRAARWLGRFLSTEPGRAAFVVAGGLMVWAVLSRLRWFRRLTVSGHPVFTGASVAVAVAALLIAAWPKVRRSAAARRIGAWLSEVGAGEAAVRVADRTAVIGMAAGALTGGLVFLWIYVPAFIEHSAFPREQLIESLKAVDPSSWQSPLDAVRALLPYNSARPFLLIAIVTLLAWLPWLRVPGAVRSRLTWLVVTAAIVVMLPIRFPQFSLWLAAVAPIPGFGAVRDPLRLIAFYELALTVGVAAALAAAPAAVWFRRVATILTLAIVAMTWNGTRFDYERSRSDYARWVEPPIQIDPACRSFFMKRGPAAYEARSGHIWSLYGVDATFIALAHQVPALNGYSGWEPRGWELANPPAPDYEQKVREWIAAHQLTGVCALDIAARTMTPWGS